MITVEHPQIDYIPRRANKEFYTKRGRLTRFSFACGYVEKYSTQQNRFNPALTTTELYSEGGGSCYHIRTTGPNVPDQFPNTPKHPDYKRQWDVADTLTEARKIYARHIKEYHRC